MASPPDYDKEPKAPDKSATNAHHEDMKTTNDPTGDQPPESDSKLHNNVANTDAENKQVGTLDDGQLRALLDEAITYKCPKDREGKSSLFKELLEEVEQDEQACEAAARELTGSRGRRAGKGRRALPHSNSLQDLVAALAAEPAPRRRANHAPPAQVSARAIHGGSLPSGVDTSFLLSEEPTRGGYLATVRCVNPPPLSERRVSVDSSRSDNEPRRSKPSSSVGVTYTARATLEIGAAGRATTTTSPSSQDKLMKALARKNNRNGGGSEERDRRKPRGPHRDREQQSDKEKILTTRSKSVGTTDEHKLSKQQEHKQAKYNQQNEAATGQVLTSKQGQNKVSESTSSKKKVRKSKTTSDLSSEALNSNINTWYEGLAEYSKVVTQNCGDTLQNNKKPLPKGSTKKQKASSTIKLSTRPTHSKNTSIPLKQKLQRQRSKEIIDYDVARLDPLNCSINDWYEGLSEYSAVLAKMTTDSAIPNANSEVPNTSSNVDANSTDVDSITIDNSDNLFICKKANFSMWKPKVNNSDKTNDSNVIEDLTIKPNRYCGDIKSEISLRKEYRQRVGKLIAPKMIDVNPKNVKSMSIGKQIEPVPGTSVDSKRKNIIQEKGSKISPIDPKSISSTKPNTSNNESYTKNEKLIELKEIISNSKFKSKTIAITEDTAIEMKDLNKNGNTSCDNFDHVVNIELNDIPKIANSYDDSFSKYYADQQKLFNALEDNKFDNNIQLNNLDNNEIKEVKEKQGNRSKDYIKSETVIDMGDFADTVLDVVRTTSPIEEVIVETSNNNFDVCAENNKSLELGIVTETIETLPQQTEEASTSQPKKSPDEHYILAELPNNAYIFLTLPKRLPTTNQDKAAMRAIENNNIQPYAPGEKHKQKKKRAKQSSADSDKKTVINKDVLRELLFENLFKNVPTTTSRAGLTTIKEVEVDSAIPFSCITTPEVVSSCNTTTATTPSSAAIVDTKPLQLASCYRAVASLTGDAADDVSAAANPATPAPNTQPRAAGTGAGGGAGGAAPARHAAHHDYKKSLDENGNAVQGYGSVLSATGQHKKPRRKKSSKNETVIKSHQIDGYQGNKDLNEVLRFIESHAARPKLRKHRDDADEKKRGGGRRKAAAGGGAPRAASLEEVSRTTLEELTEADAAPDVADADDFTPVTARRRRRRAPPPPAAPSAPPSDRSNDSTDEGYAVPDLISSCREYPALQAPRRPPPPPRRAPDVVLGRRAPPPPPVVLRPRRASPHEQRHLRGVTFGFELNETLLHAAPAAAPPAADALPAHPAHLPAAPPRYKPPPAAAPLDPRLLDSLVAYVAHAWEDVIKCGNGKVRYYSE